MPTGEERREFQRLRLDPPVPATLGASEVTLVEVGILGARVRHDGPLLGAIVDSVPELRFQSRGGEIVLRCEVVRTQEGESGLRFLAAIGDSGDRLRHLLADLVSRALDETREPRLRIKKRIDGDKTVRGKEAEFVCYRLDGGTWQKRAVFLPEQPAVGFTVARDVDADEVQRLCRVYQASDDEGRRLIRLFAELSVSEAMEIPPRA
jgi:hypothetical protein